MKKTIAWLLAGGLACVASADTGTVTQAVTMQGPVYKHTLTWTSVTNNGVMAATTNYVRGELLRVTFVPGSGSSAPSNSYALTVKDENGVDVLAGLGAALASNAVTSVRPGVSCSSGGATTNMAPFALNSLLYVHVTNCGNAKSGVVDLYLR